MVSVKQTLHSIFLLALRFRLGREADEVEEEEDEQQLVAEGAEREEEDNEQRDVSDGVSRAGEQSPIWPSKPARSLKNCSTVVFTFQPQ